MRSPSKPDVALPEWNKSWLKPVVWIGFCTVLMPLTVTAILSGKSTTEKMLTGMAQPLFVAIVATMAIGATLLPNRGGRRIAVSTPHSQRLVTPKSECSTDEPDSHPTSRSTKKFPNQNVCRPRSK